MQQLPMFSSVSHAPIVVLGARDEWNVMCPSCSDAMGEVVPKCLIIDDWPPTRLVDIYYKETLTRIAKRSRVGGVRLSAHATDTQRAAVRGMLPRSGSVQEKVLRVISSHPDGLTDHEIEKITGLSHQTASAARNSLMNKGFVRDSGIRRNNDNGNPSIAWVKVDV